jgi:hypothetical protein
MRKGVALAGRPSVAGICGWFRQFTSFLAVALSTLAFTFTKSSSRGELDALLDVLDGAACGVTRAVRLAESLEDIARHLEVDERRQLRQGKMGRGKTMCAGD